MNKIIYFLIILAIFISSVNAETGTVTVVNETTIPNYRFAEAVQPGAISFNRITFYTAGYSNLESFNFHPEGVTFVHQFESTSFTCTSGCTGGGVFWYDDTTDAVYYSFNGGDTFTSTDITLSFTKNIAANITVGNKFRNTSLSTLGVNSPVGIMYDTGDYILTTQLVSTPYRSVIVSSRVTDAYNVTYVPYGGFTINVVKGKNINTKWAIKKATGVNYTSETTFNALDFSYTNLTYEGIIVNVSVEQGAYTIKEINISVTLPAYGQGGSQNGQMNFDTVQPYFKGYFGINISMNDTVFDPNKRYFIDVFDPSGKEKAGFPIEISSASYTTGRSWVFSDYGLWNATLTDCNQFNFLCGAAGFSGLPPSYQQLIDCVNNPLCGTRSNLVDIAVQVINVSEYTYSITSDATSYATGDTIFFNITSTNPVGAYFTILDSLGNVVNPLANNVLIGEGSTYYNVTIPDTIQNGNYTAILALNTGYYAQVKAYTFSIGIVSGRDSISWGDNNIFGYTNTLSWSNGNNTNYITVSKIVNNTLKEYDNFTVNALEQKSKSYLMDATGFWSAKLYNTSSGVSKYANISVFASSVGLCNTKLDDFVCFNNQSYFPGDTYTINYQAKSAPNDILIGTYIDPYSKISVKVLNPSGVVVFNKTISDCTGTLLGTPIRCPVNVPISGSLTSKFKVSDAPGTYQVLLVYDRRDPHGTTDAVVEDVWASNTAILVSKPISTPTPPSGAAGTTAMGNNLLSFMYVPAFWGVILWFSVVVISASSGARNSMSNTGVVALAAALILSIVGLFDPYRWFVIAGLIIIAGIWFMVGRNITTGD